MFVLQRAIVGIQKWFYLHQYVGNQSAVAHVQPLPLGRVQVCMEATGKEMWPQLQQTVEHVSGQDPHVLTICAP